MATSTDAAGKVRIRVPQKVQAGDIVPVRVLVMHPMETMQFRDGRPVPKNYNFIHHVEATYNGAKIFEGATTQGVSQNPFVSFSLRADAPGTVEVTFQDTEGQTYHGRAEIRF